ncbi:MAG: MATE family efflux transporter, partial [Oscillospiraceae bacterium]
IASMYFIILIVRNRHRMYISLNPIRVWSALKSDIPGRVISIGIPASVQNILVTTSAMLMNNLAVPFGAAAVAAMGIAKKIDMIPMYISMGLGQGIMPLVGYCYASKDYHRMKKTVLFTAKLAVGVSVTLVAAIELLSPNIVELFIMDSATVAYGTDFLRVFCIATIFMSINMLMISVFQATGQGRGALVLAVIRKAVLEIPLLFLLDRLFPLYGIVWVQTIVELLVLPVSLLLYRHFIDGLPHAGSV